MPPKVQPPQRRAQSIHERLVQIPPGSHKCRRVRVPQVSILRPGLSAVACSCRHSQPGVPFMPEYHPGMGGVWAVQSISSMAYQVLARKYRPQRFANVVGQDHVTVTLANALAQDRIAHGYIFSGHRGIGKTTIARILAMSLNCRNPIGSAARPTVEPCRSANPAPRSAPETPSMSSRSMPPPIAASTRSASCATPHATPPPATATRSTSSTRPTRSPTPPSTPSSKPSRSRPPTSSS